LEKNTMMKKGVQVFSLSGKTALITGATGYLGSAMAAVLAEAGAHILVNSRSKERCDALVSKILSMGYSAESAVFDITDQQAVDSFFEGKQELALHILINNAYTGGGGSIEISKAEAYAKSYDVNVIATHNLLMAALSALRRAVQQSGDASVINLTSMYAMVSPDQRIYESVEGVNPPFYGLAKAALLQWTRYAACEFGAESIRVNSLSPGPFPSESVQVSNPNFIKKLADKVPLGRVGQSEEIKGPILFLASSASSFVNGSNIVVDGGWTCW
jgi:NAD(P)-dependent dehydrogenase (short-subunit alcohol dehydrogenase family)